MSRVWMKVPAFIPSSVDINDALNIIYYPLRQLEGGLICPAAVEGDGAALVKSSLYTSVADSPHQATITHTKGPTAIVHCQTCFHPASTIADSDKVCVDRCIVDLITSLKIIHHFLKNINMNEIYMT
jgi:hypothetical protein